VNNKIQRGGFAAIAAVGVTVAVTGCTVVSTAPDERAVVYSGGMATSKTFSNCVDPSTRKVESVTKNASIYPAGQRTYVFSDERKDNKPDGDLIGDTSALLAPSSDQVQLAVSGQVQFELTSDCKKLQKFHEQIGIKFDNGKDWEKLLQTYLAHAIKLAVTQATQKYKWTDLYTNNGDAMNKWSAEVETLLKGTPASPDGKIPAVKGLVDQAMGDSYFTISGTVLQKPGIPDDLRKSVEAFARAQADNAAQLQRNAQILSEADGIRPLIAALGGDVNAYVLLQAIKDGKISGVVPVPAGSPVIVGPR
jgi:hypothetical protein